MVRFDLSQVKLRFAARGGDLLNIRVFDYMRGTSKGRPTDLSCPECEAKVVPVLSPAHQIADHFRHEAETNCEVSGSGESAIHFNAKAFLAQELNKYHSASLVHQCRNCSNWYAFLKIEHYDYAKPELKIANRRRPDVSCVSGSDVVGAAEIFHTHAVDPEKQADLNAAGLTWFEIPAMNVSRQYFKFVEGAHIFSIDAKGAGITYPEAPSVCEACAELIRKEEFRQHQYRLRVQQERLKREHELQLEREREEARREELRVEQNREQEALSQQRQQEYEEWQRQREEKWRQEAEQRAKEQAAREEAERIAKEQVARLEAERHVLEQSGGPARLLENGDLQIPLNCIYRFRHWVGGQPLVRTMAELSAPLETWRKYAAYSSHLLTPRHSEVCKGRIERADEIAYCADCGYFTEAF